MPIHLRRRQGRAMRAQGRCLLLHADEGRCSLVLRRLPARFGRARSHSSGTRFAAGCFPVGRSTRPRGIQADVRQMVTRAAAGCLISPSLPARQPPANIARTVRDRRACGVGRDHACPFGRGALRSAGCAPSRWIVRVCLLSSRSVGRALYSSTGAIRFQVTPPTVLIGVPPAAGG